MFKGYYIQSGNVSIILYVHSNFEELPESFIIFITEDDKYDEGVPVYHIERKIEEKGNALFADGLHILYVNGEYQDVETPIGRLMHDFYCTRSEDMYSKIWWRKWRRRGQRDR